MEKIIKNLIEPHVHPEYRDKRDWFKATYTGLFKNKRAVITALVPIGKMAALTAVVGEADNEVDAWERAIDNLNELLNGRTDWHAIDEIGDYLISLGDMLTKGNR